MFHKHTGKRGYLAEVIIPILYSKHGETLCVRTALNNSYFVFSKKQIIRITLDNLEKVPERYKIQLSETY